MPPICEQKTCTASCILIFRLKEDLAEVLESVDYICSVLPSTPSTKGLLDGGILQRCAKKVNGYVYV